MESQMLPLSSFDYDPKYYPRASGREDWLTVTRYADALLADPDKQLPPIIAVRTPKRKQPNLILDGLHRTRSYHKAGRETIPAVIERLPESKWFARSVELNATHGRCFDVGDKAFIATRLKEEGWDVGSVAKLLQMRVESIEKIVAERVVKLSATAALSIPGGRANRQVGEDNYGFLKSPFKEAANTNRAEDALACQGPVAAMDANHILASAISLFEAETLPRTDTISESVARIRDLSTAWLKQA